MVRVNKAISSFRQSEIAELLKHARVKVRIPGLRILTAPSLLPDYGRVLIITPRRSGNAPQRNLIRRRIKALFVEDNLFRSGFDFVVIVRREAIDTEFKVLKKLLDRSARLCHL